ncbi:hypothetical protein H0N99_02440, partial [Candidatus Micrarchaeota archaeon]|nr:hypothetical protein [Candidatus Micrarchaeota archaeon]
MGKFLLLFLLIISLVQLSYAATIITTGCNPPTAGGSCTYSGGGGDCDIGPGTCVSTYTCTAPTPWCPPTLPNAGSVPPTTCTVSHDRVCDCKRIAANYFCGLISGSCTYSGTCNYNCNVGWYDCDANAANGCESNAPCGVIATQLSQSASPPSPQVLGTTVRFNCYYYRGLMTPVGGATVNVNINGTNYLATYNASDWNYTYSTSMLAIGTNTWYCDASAAGFQSQVGSPQTYTITSVPVIATKLTQSVSPPSPQVLGTTVRFNCYYYRGLMTPVGGATVNVNINGTNHLATYNASDWNYTYSTSTLAIGTNTWYCDASAAGFQSQVGSPQTYTITSLPVTPTTLSPTVAPPSPAPSGANVDFQCNYRSGVTPLSGASCNVTIDGVDNGATFSGVDNLFHYTTSTLAIGIHSWSCSCAEAGYASQVVAAPAYNITAFAIWFPVAAMKTKADGYFYMPNATCVPNLHTIKIDLWYYNATSPSFMEGDQ